MTIVNDPYGSNTVIYSPDGATLQNISVPGSGVTSLQTPSSISHVVANVPTTGPFPGPSDGLELPVGANIGDRVYIYVVGPWPLNVLAPSGEDISGYPTINISTPSGAIFIKYSSTSWANGAR